MDGMHSQMSGMQIQMDGMHSQMSGMQIQMDGMQKEVGDISQELKITNTRLHTVEEHVADMISHITHMQLQINELHQSRNLVKIRYGMEWMIASFVIAILASGITLGFGRS
jgi:hypothetical protein